MANYWKHYTAMVADDATIGEKTKIWQFCNIMRDVMIGCNCNLGQNVFVENGVIVGNNVKIKNNVALYTGIECEDDVFLGPSCVFTNVVNPRSFIERKSEFKKTIIKKGATIGANATIICGHTIGRYAMIGAGSVVTTDVEDYALMVGNPAKQIGYVCECGGKLVKIRDEKFVCKDCGKTYISDKLRLSETKL